MIETFTDGLIFPALSLALLAWLVPKLVSMTLAEGARPLMLNALLSSIILFCLSGGYFFVLYLSQGIPFWKLLEPGWAAVVTYYGRLGLTAAIIWAPIMILSVAALPRTWVHEKW